MNQNTVKHFYKFNLNCQIGLLIEEFKCDHFIVIAFESEQSVVASHQLNLCRVVRLLNKDWCVLDRLDQLYVHNGHT